MAGSPEIIQGLFRVHQEALINRGDAIAVHERRSTRWKHALISLGTITSAIFAGVFGGSMLARSGLIVAATESSTDIFTGLGGVSGFIAGAILEGIYRQRSRLRRMQ